MDARFRKKVAQMGHSFRTPLQTVALVLEELSSSPEIETKPDLKSTVGAGMDRILDVRQDLLDLLEPETVAREEFDLIEVLDYAIDAMKPIAKQRSVAILKWNRWPSGVFVRGVPAQVQRAFTCLLDNATKYSYRGQRSDGGGLFQVRVRVTEEQDRVKVQITNYGIGIPQDKLDAIGDYGLRAEIPDLKTDRLGTGLGLPIAIDVVEDLGGWLDVSSEPARSATEAEKHEYHRFITTVEVVLPTTRRS
jgi:signal transduction histidine kinase